MIARKNNMRIKFFVGGGLVKIELYAGKKKIDALSFPEENNLSEKLLPQIDKLLKQNKLNPWEIKDVEVSTDTPESFTTSRIAQTVGKLWNWGSLRIKN